MSAIAGLLRQLTLAFGAGMVGVVVMFLVGRGLTAVNAQSLFGIAPPEPRPFPASAYGPLVWGGIYGLLLVLPVLNRLWWLKGLLIGFAPAAGLIFYFNKALQTAAPGRLAYIVLIHLIWGLGAALWWRITAMRAEAAGQRFSAYR